MSLSTRSTEADSLTSELIPEPIDGKQPSGISDLFQALVRCGVFCVNADDIVAAFDNDAGEFLGIDPASAVGAPTLHTPDISPVPQSRTSVKKAESKRFASPNPAATARRSASA